MKRQTTLLLAAAGLFLVGCGYDGDIGEQPISTRYMHKYGYDVNKAEWESQRYPGQVLTTLRNGTTITESFEEGILHGPKSRTYPHSQTIKVLEQYDHGTLKSRMNYSIRGIPEVEEVFLSADHKKVTNWYPNGTPKSCEEYDSEQLIAGQYFNTSNELDSKIDNGMGERTVRNASGDILTKEIFRDFEVTYVETYHPNETLYTATPYRHGKVHGEKKEFAMTGEPVSIENWRNGFLHGLSTYYQNGYKYLEISYRFNKKFGVEKHYIDGEILAEETHWKNDQRHGSSIVYYDGVARTSWYHRNINVTKEKYDELLQRESMIAHMNERGKLHKVR
ncbi:MAG: hypothetical protein S4CHLAM102_04430 [Chlamydiia bacterium]|nr:hypothetical protein [Chlamydiia bacterium]